MNKAQIKHMVDRFLRWKLPDDFRPDNGIFYQRPSYHPNVDATPTGTNLLDALQADAMVRYMVEGMPTAPSADLLYGPEGSEYAAMGMAGERTSNE